jgi:hypothetical protein
MELDEATTKNKVSKMKQKIIMFDRSTIYIGTFVFSLNIIGFLLLASEDGFKIAEIVIVLLTILFYAFLVTNALKEKLIMTESKIYYTDGINEQELSIHRIKKITAEQGRFRFLEFYLRDDGPPFIFQIHALEEHFFEIPRWVHKIANGKVEIDQSLLDNRSFMYRTRVRYNAISFVFLIIGLLTLSKGCKLL